MGKQPNRKLMLRRETLKALLDDDLANVNGGESNNSSASFTVTAKDTCASSGGGGSSLSISFSNTVRPSAATWTLCGGCP
jgi:hypothetical protein